MNTETRTAAPITASEARALSGEPSHVIIERALNTAYDAIRVAATMRKTKIILRTGLWEQGGYKNDPNWIVAGQRLRDAGFGVKFHYVESQFVDMGTEVSWW